MMNFPAELKYSKSHEWVKMDGDVAVIGISDFAQDALGDVVFINLPAEGDSVTAGESFGDVESVKAVSDVVCPVSGTICEVNEALADALYSVFTASGAKTLSELTEEKLKSAAAMLKTYKNLDRETRRMVTEAFMLFFKLGTKNFVLDTQEEGSREIENIRKKISEQYQKLVERKK